MPKKQLTYFRTMRLKSGLIQADVAALIGTSSSQISRIEANHCKPTTRQFLALSIVYEKDGRELMAGYVEYLSRNIGRSAQEREGVVVKDIAARNAANRVGVIRIIRKRLTNTP